jgi:hypothetical protein
LVEAQQSGACDQKPAADHANAAWIDVGCVISYGPNISELYRRAAVFVDKSLREPNHLTFQSNNRRSAISSST